MIKGIPNLGNTCFLNTCLQLLLQTPELEVNDNDSEVATKNILEKHLWIEWKKWKENSTDESFHSLFQTIRYIADKKGFTLFTGYVQNDLSEFLLFFMDTLHEYFKRPRNMKINGNIQNETDKIAVDCYKMLQDTYQNEYSEIIDTFYGIYISKIYSLEKDLSSKPESFFLLDLPIPHSTIPNSISIYSCFDHYISPEYMENGWIDETTKQMKSVHKQIAFWCFPKILVITLQRCQLQPNHISKKMDLIDFPITNLDLSKYVVGYNARKYVYDLYGVVNHIGDVNGGHYTAFVLSEEKWYHCNDHIIENVIDPRQIITPMAYVLFYRMHSIRDKTITNIL